MFQLIGHFRSYTLHLLSKHCMLQTKEVIFASKTLKKETNGTEYKQLCDLHYKVMNHHYIMKNNL